MKKLLYIFSILAINSCTKDTIDLPAYWDCNKALNLDSSAIANKLIGSWFWTKQSCEGDKSVRRADKKIVVIFRSNSTYELTEDGNIISQGNWQLKKVDREMYGLSLSQPGFYLDGRILLCSREVLFNNSYIDGCDNMFAKSF